jgi:hypothetical protein
MEVRLSMLERGCQFPAVLLPLRHVMSRPLARDVGQDREERGPVSGGVMQLAPQPTKAMRVALCIHHTPALLREWTRGGAPTRAPRADHLPGHPPMLTDHKEAASRVDLSEKGSGTKMAIGDPQLSLPDALEDCPKERALLRLAIFTGKDMRDEPLGWRIDHERFARQGAPCGLPQFLEAMLTGFEAVAIDNVDPIALKPRGPLTVHGLDERGQLASAIAHQFRRSVWRTAIEFVIDRNDGGPHVGFLSPVRRPHRGLHTKDHVAPQSVDGGKQELSGVWLLSGTLLPQIEAVGTQHPLQRGAYHDGDGTLFHKSFKHLTKHGGPPEWQN